MDRSTCIEILKIVQQCYRAEVCDAFRFVLEFFDNNTTITTGGAGGKIFTWISA